MICKNCNKKIPECRNFCPYCGMKIVYYQEPDGEPVAVPYSEFVEKPSEESAAKLVVDPIMESASDKVEQGSKITRDSETKRNSGNEMKYVAIISILATLLCCAVFFIFYQNLHKPNLENTKVNVTANTDIEPTDETPEKEEFVNTNPPISRTSVTDETKSSSREVIFNPEAMDNTVKIDVHIPRYAVTFNEHSYYVFDYDCESWNEAEEYCESQGGYLAVINTPEENEFLYDYMVGSGYDEVFFGYTDQNNEGIWSWVSGKSSEFTDWGINEEGSVEPNSSNEYEDYAHMNSSMHDGHWNDKKYGQKTTWFFCEWDVVSHNEMESIGRPTKEGVPIKNNALNEADNILELGKDDEVDVLYSLMNNDGEVWYYVQHELGFFGYIKAGLLELL